MSSQFGKVVSLIIKERFGPVVDKVASLLFTNGGSHLLFVKRRTELPLPKVKEALCVLIKYGLVTFKPSKNVNAAIYSLNPDRALLMLRYPKFINLIKRKFGEEAESLVEEILLRGYSTASDLIIKVLKRLQEDQERVTSLVQIKEKFQSLVTAKYLVRIPTTSEVDAAVPLLTVKEHELFLLPNIDLNVISLIQQDENLPPTDAGIYWTINVERFHEEIRDRIIINAISKKFDENAAELIRNFLQQMYTRTAPWQDVSNPIPMSEVKNAIKKMNTHPQLVAFFDQYVSLLEQDNSNVIRKVGEAGGGSYQIYIKDLFVQLTWEVLEQIVLEKFDAKAARIFRLVKTKKFIEPEHIQQLAMIPAKEAKNVSYDLLEQNFLAIQELKKAGTGSGPNKSFTLFTIKLNQVVRMVLELCYKTLFNIITRKNHEKFIYKRLIDKKKRADTIILSMKQQGASDEHVTEIEEMVTPPEKEFLQKISKKMHDLNLVELEIDDTMFLLQMFFAYE